MTLSRRTLLAAGLMAAGVLSSQPGLAQSGPRIGAPAPAFTAFDSNGRPIALSEYAGKTVVLEWTNDECPYVRKHYDGRNMQVLQKKWTDRSVVWLSIISSAPGEQGFVAPEKANGLTVERGASPTAVLLDPKGEVGRLYRAQVTPHMYVIAPDGRLAYMGGIDDKPSSRPDSLRGAMNYVDAALSEIAAGKPVSTTTARPYGCTVKFTS